MGTWKNANKHNWVVIKSHSDFPAKPTSHGIKIWFCQQKSTMPWTITHGVYTTYPVHTDGLTILFFAEMSHKWQQMDQAQSLIRPSVMSQAWLIRLFLISVSLLCEPNPFSRNVSLNFRTYKWMLSVLVFYLMAMHLSSSVMSLSWFNLKKNQAFFPLSPDFLRGFIEKKIM